MDDLAKRARGLELLLRLGLELHSERNLRSLLDRIWRELTRVLEAERSSLFLVSEETHELYSLIAQKEGEIRFSLDKGIAGAVAASGVSLLIPDAYQDPRFNPEIDRRTGFRTRSILAVPLKNRQGGVLGVAQVLNRLDGKPFDHEDRGLLEALASMAAIAIETVLLYEEQKSATEAVISGLLMAMEMRDPLAASHSQEVRAYARAIAEEMGFPAEDVRRIEWAAALHDLGKIAIPDRILRKDSPLSPDEQARYESHVLWTREFLEAMGFSGEMAGIEAIAPYHHKRFVGGGFPPGVPDGTEVPQEARVIAVADAFVVGMRARWGKRALSPDKSLRSIEDQAGCDFDPEAVRCLARLRPKFEQIRARADPLASRS
jgi:HD-GYP domain-containing protein (c-di-GMP phosphodiesterase class II)